MHVKSRHNLYLRVSLLSSREVFLTIVLTGVQYDLFLCSLCVSVLTKVIVAGHKIIEFLQIFQREFNSTSSPGCKKEHGLSFEFLHILIAKRLSMVVLENFEPIGAFELTVKERFKADSKDGRREEED